MRFHNLRIAIVLGAAIALMLPAVVNAQRSGKKEYQFRGKVEKVDTKAKTLSVNGEKVEGWMDAMTMLYKVGNPDVIGKLKVGDQITAKVYEGDQSTLYDVQVVPTKEGEGRK